MADRGSERVRAAKRPTRLVEQAPCFLKVLVELAAEGAGGEGAAVGAGMHPAARALGVPVRPETLASSGRKKRRRGGGLGRRVH